MDRWACVNVRALPLQLLLAKRPEWANSPVAVVSHDAPQGEIRWVGRKAKQAGISPGRRYGAALGLVPQLRAGVVSEGEIEQGIRFLTIQLQRFTPEVEPSYDLPGIFWLNARGLHALYPSATAWARSVLDGLRTCGFYASMVVGYTRFGTCAVATICRDITIFTDTEQEQAAALRVPLCSLGLSPDLVETLHLLGVHTVGEFVKLPPEGLRCRFGEEAYTLYTRATGAVWAPLQPHREEPPLRHEVVLDTPEMNSIRLIALIARMAYLLRPTVEKRGEVVAELEWTFSFEKREPSTYHVRPAAPTLNVEQLLELVRLRMESVTLPEEVIGLVLSVRAVPAEHGQVTLFVAEPHRDLAAADRALARIRAEFGARAIVRARLQDGHLPEARFRWEPISGVRFPRPMPVMERSLVRRFYAKPEPLPPASRRRLSRTAGPHIISGGWWMRPIHREYYFVLTKSGDLLWVYYDRTRRQWFVQGHVE